MTISGTILRRSVALAAIPAFALVVITHLALRSDRWVREWYWTIDSFNFVTILLAPLVAGVATWDGANWAPTADAARSTGHVGRVVFWAWVPSAVLATAVFALGALAAGVMTVLAGTPGLPAPAEAWALMPAFGQLWLFAALGVSLGWTTGRPLLAPVVAVAVFAVLFAGYIVLPTHWFGIGGATGSLLSLSPRPALVLLQVAVYGIASAAVLSLAASISQPSNDRRRLPALLAVLTAVGALWLAAVGGMRFAEGPAAVNCHGSAPEICLGEGYEFMRAPLEERTREPFRRLQAAGFSPPVRVTQDVTDTGPGTMQIGITVPDLVELQNRLVFVLIPPDCDVMRDQETADDYATVWTWLADLLGLDAPAGPSIDPAVALGDSPASRQVVRDISRRLQTCRSPG